MSAFASKLESPDWLALLMLPLKVGRFIMDIGFGSLVEKFEQHFGPWPTKILLAAIGLAAIIVCLRVIFADAILPIIDLIRGVGGETLYDTLGRIAFGLAVALVSGTVSAVIYRWLAVHTANVIIDRAKQNTQDAEEIIAEAKVAAKEARRAYDVLTQYAREIEVQTGKKIAGNRPPSSRPPE